MSKKTTTKKPEPRMTATEIKKHSVQTLGESLPDTAVDSCCGMVKPDNSWVRSQQRFEEGFAAGKRESSDHKLAELRSILQETNHRVITYERELKDAQITRDSILQRIELLREELGF